MQITLLLAPHRKDADGRVQSRRRQFYHQYLSVSKYISVSGWFWRLSAGVVQTYLATNFYRQTGTAVLPGMQHAVKAAVDNIVVPIFMRSPESSAHSVLRAATLPSAAVAGQYLSNLAITRPDPFAEDSAYARELWDLACDLTGVSTHESLSMP